MGEMHQSGCWICIGRIRRSELLEGCLHGIGLVEAVDTGRIHGSCDNEQVAGPKAAWYGDWQANAIASQDYAGAPISVRTCIAHAECREASGEV